MRARFDRGLRWAEHPRTGRRCHHRSAYGGFEGSLELANHALHRLGFLGGRDRHTVEVRNVHHGVLEAFATKRLATLVRRQKTTIRCLCCDRQVHLRFVPVQRLQLPPVAPDVEAGRTEQGVVEPVFDDLLRGLDGADLIRSQNFLSCRGAAPETAKLSQTNSVAGHCVGHENFFDEVFAALHELCVSPANRTLRPVHRLHVDFGLCVATGHDRDMATARRILDGSEHLVGNHLRLVAVGRRDVDDAVHRAARLEERDVELTDGLQLGNRGHGTNPRWDAVVG